MAHLETAHTRPKLVHINYVFSLYILDNNKREGQGTVRES